VAGRRSASARPARILLAAVGAAVAATVVLAVRGGPSAAAPASDAGSAAAAGVINAVGAENQYADVIRQVGGKYVRVTALLSNPNTDPHTFEASSAVARQVAGAALVVQNGLGYDGFMTAIEDATPSAGRTVIDVQHLLNLPDRTPNPHLWYQPATMPRVAAAVAAALSRLRPADAAYFQANARAFGHALTPWSDALAEFRAAHHGTAVAVTEPVADYLLQAAGVVNKTPWTFQADVMNGTDPAPQDVAAVRALLANRQVAALIYNEQVTDPLTESLIALAAQHGIPVVGVYEIMPQPGYDYQSWMLAETAALRQAVVRHVSTEHL
jgi:zinc/manganese transport system substrate-binding protein